MMLCLKLTLLTLLIAAPGLLFAAQHTVVTCNGNVQSLNCSTGLIRVLNTVYGRTVSRTCPPPNRSHTATNTNCRSQITSIADRCNGQQQCTVSTNLLNTADPCPGTNKYYNTTYECIAGTNVVVCETLSSTLNCGSDTIDIINAIFGSSNTTSCTSANPRSMCIKTNCHATGVRSDVEARCEGRTRCTVEASSCYNFKDGCKRTPKFLSVGYRCIKKLITCESSTANLNCGSLKIEIISADYGRTDKTTCDGGRPASQLANTDCHSTTALNKVKTSCNGLSTCSVAATNAVFTDPCGGTYKYQTIEYACV